MHKRKGKENRPRKGNLVDYRDLERNVRKEIAKEFFQDKKEKGKK
ncbi:MAG: hypothetical protein WBK54_06110 [Bacilli bacterium]|jgi:hypothetical protein